jgi:hypothetical protein
MAERRRNRPLNAKCRGFYARARTIMNGQRSRCRMRRLVRSNNGSEKVQQHLIRIAELSRAAAESLVGRNDDLICELYKPLRRQLTLTGPSSCRSPDHQRYRPSQKSSSPMPKRPASAPYPSVTSSGIDRNVDKLAIAGGQVHRNSRSWALLGRRIGRRLWAPDRGMGASVAVGLWRTGRLCVDGSMIAGDAGDQQYSHAANHSLAETETPE